MVTTITTLTILGKSNWNEMEIYLMIWMWRRMWQTYATTMTQMTTVTMTTLMRKKTPKLKEYPSYPHTGGRMGAMARDCPISVEIGIGVLLLLLLLHA